MASSVARSTLPQTKLALPSANYKKDSGQGDRGETKEDGVDGQTAEEKIVGFSLGNLKCLLD